MQFKPSQPEQPGPGEYYSQWPPAVSSQSSQGQASHPLLPYAQSEQYQHPQRTHDGFTQHSLPAMPPQFPPQYAHPQQYSRPPEQSRRPTTRNFILAIAAGLVILVLGVALRNWLGGLPLSGSAQPHNAGMSEAQYKASTTDTSVASLDKDGNLDSGKDVHFTATILNFVKDSSGNTAGANVTDPGGFTAIIQVEFPAGTDITQLNLQDKIEVWGTDDGTQTGTNAFGATVHEVAVSALYVTDQTTGYTTG